MAQVASAAPTGGRTGGTGFQQADGKPRREKETGDRTAPGHPGQAAGWAWGAKQGVGCATEPASTIWFTLSHGIVTEIYYRSIDTASTHGLDLLVGDRGNFFSKESEDTDSELGFAEPGVPDYRLINTCRSGRYLIGKEILADPRRPVLLQQTQFKPLRGELGDYCLCVFLTPRLGNQGADNTAWVGAYRGVPMLFARREDYTVALACSAPWKKCSAGFVGVSDGRHDLESHKQMTWSYITAEHGNVALTGEIDLTACAGKFVLAVAFGRDETEAGHRARASLLQGFTSAREEHNSGWSSWLKGMLPLEGSRQHAQDLYRTSAMVMRAHESKAFPGAIVASMAIPWGFANGDGDMGYHLVWARDMIETGGGLLAVRRHEDARRMLFYLNVTQEADGHWSQNMFLDGRPFWDGIQLDEVAFVILLVGMARTEGALSDESMQFFWPMVRRAAGFLVRRGPVTPLDRWEELPGYHASTMAAEIPALLVAAEMAARQGEKALADYLRETADAWNDAVEKLIYVRDTEIARRAGVDGYYVRFAGPDQPQALAPAQGSVTLPNHSKGQGHKPYAAVVGPDALALVRFGLRSADDPRIVNTVKVIDLLCKVETPFGPCWHRYNDDGYGEKEDGSPFDKTGIGRVWPLLTGERAHYELAAGRTDEAERLLRTMETFASPSGMFPEQVWDSADIPDKELYFGRPSGSAMPLVWAHAEYVKLRRSLHEGHVFDLPRLAVQRYVVDKTKAHHVCWRPEQAWRAVAPGKKLRIELPTSALIRWSADSWQTLHEASMQDTGLGIHYADLPTEDQPVGAVVRFRLPQDGAEKTFHVLIEEEVQEK